MPNFKKLIDREINKGFDNFFQRGNLTEEVTFRFMGEAGEYNVETDSIDVSYVDVGGIHPIVGSPSEDDMRDNDVLKTDATLTLPTAKLPQKPAADTDKVIRANGELWDIRKVMGVPGESIYCIYIYRT